MFFHNGQVVIVPSVMSTLPLQFTKTVLVTCSFFKQQLQQWVSFIHSGYFYSASSSPRLLRGTPNYRIDTVY